MTKEEWKKVEEDLKILYNRVNLDCDGYLITLVLARHGIYKNLIDVFINGKISYLWTQNDCEERKRFFYECKKFLYSKKDRKRLTKLKFRSDSINKKFSIYYPFWNTFSSLKRHLIKNNKEIKLVLNLQQESTVSFNE